MRVALVVAGLPPYARSGVEAHAAALARALTDEGLTVELVAPRCLPGLLPLAQRREERDGWAVTWVNMDPQRPAEEAERADAFAAFLDRERPDLVHFEDVASFGLAAVGEADARGLPTVYCAHDWFAVSDQVHLLAPDGAAFEPGDRELEARMRCARALLCAAGVPATAGDHVTAEDLTPATFKRLGDLLHGTPDEGDRAGIDAAREELRERLERKRAAFSQFGARFAATRHLARRLSATLGRAVDWRGPGIDPAAYSEVHLRRHSDGPVRFGYLGSLDRSAGVALLLEAFEGLDPTRATLTIHGDSSQRDHVRRLREQARELRVHWGGPFRVEDTPALLAGFDVRVLPTAWDGGAAFGALEAAAAKRPVVAARTEGLGDVVRDDVDGLLFTPGSALELRRALERFADEEFLLDRFELELRAPRTMRSVAREWIDTYRELIEDRAASRPQPQVPAELVALRGRFEDLAQRSTRELMGQVLAGLELLGEQMGLAATPRDFLLSAVGRGSALRDSAAADRRVIERLQRGHERLSQARADLEQRSSWHTSQLAELRERLEERAAALQARGQEAMQARRARDELAQAKEADAEERSRLEGELAERLSAIAGLEQELDTTRGAHDRLEEERVALARTLAESAQELRFLRELALGDEDDDALSDREVVEAHLTSLERELAGLRDHEQWLRRELGGLVEVLTKVSDTMAQARPDEQGLNAGRDGLERIVRELGWRRGEMAAAREASKRWFTRLAGGELATRIQGWQEGEA